MNARYDAAGHFRCFYRAQRRTELTAQLDVLSLAKEKMETDSAWCADVDFFTASIPCSPPKLSRYSSPLSAPACSRQCKNRNSLGCVELWKITNSRSSSVSRRKTLRILIAKRDAKVSTFRAACSCRQMQEASEHTKIFPAASRVRPPLRKCILRVFRASRQGSLAGCRHRRLPACQFHRMNKLRESHVAVKRQSKTPF